MGHVFFGLVLDVVVEVGHEAVEEGGEGGGGGREGLEFVEVFFHLGGFVSEGLRGGEYMGKVRTA